MSGDAASGDTEAVRDAAVISQEALRALGLRVGLLYLAHGVAVWLLPLRSPGVVWAASVTGACAWLGFLIWAVVRRGGVVRTGAAVLSQVLLAGLLAGALPRPLGATAVVLATGVLTALPAALCLALGLRAGLVAFSATVLGSALSGLGLGLFGFLGPLVTTSIAGLVHVLVMRGRQRAAAAISARDAAFMQLSATRLRWESQRATDRHLHDTVLTTLSVISHGAQGVPADELAAACRRDLAFLTGGADAQPSLPADRSVSDAGASLPEAISAVAQAEGVVARVHVTGPPRALSPDVHAAVLLAVTECLRNVRRHAGVDAVDVVCDWTGPEACVLVVDEGEGFDPSSVPPDRLGLRESVRARLAEVGGSAAVWSAPGRGTTVMLHVPTSGGQR